jgi:hypothetical protein
MHTTQTHPASGAVLDARRIPSVDAAVDGVDVLSLVAMKGIAVEDVVLLLDLVLLLIIVLLA